VTNSGALKLVPLLSESGTRLSMMASDRIYYGRVLPWRRTMIGRMDCPFDYYKRMIMDISAMFRSRSDDATGEFIYTQYHEDNPSEAALLVNKFVKGNTKVVCRLKVDLRSGSAQVI
jgi:hypothetical protein